MVQVRGLRKRKNGRWETQIMHMGVRHYLGTFDTAEAALQARNQRARELSDLDEMQGIPRKRGKRIKDSPGEMPTAPSLRELTAIDEQSLHASMHGKAAPISCGAAFTAALQQSRVPNSSVLDLPSAVNDPGTSQLLSFTSGSSLFHDVHAAAQTAPAASMVTTPALEAPQEVCAPDTSGMASMPERYLMQMRSQHRSMQDLRSMAANALHMPSQKHSSLVRELAHHGVVQTGVVKSPGDFRALSSNVGRFMDSHSASYDMQCLSHLPPLADTEPISQAAKQEHPVQHVRPQQQDPLSTPHADIATLSSSLLQSISAPFLPQQQHQQQHQQQRSVARPAVHLSLAEELCENDQCVQAAAAAAAAASQPQPSRPFSTQPVANAQHDEFDNQLPQLLGHHEQSQDQDPNRERRSLAATLAAQHSVPAHAHLLQHQEVDRALQALTGQQPLDTVIEERGPSRGMMHRPPILDLEQSSQANRHVAALDSLLQRSGTTAGGSLEGFWRNGPHVVESGVPSEAALTPFSRPLVPSMQRREVSSAPNVGQLDAMDGKGCLGGIFEGL
jgi:hypothetical protein